MGGEGGGGNFILWILCKKIEGVSRERRSRVGSGGVCGKCIEGRGSVEEGEGVQRRGGMEEERMGLCRRGGVEEESMGQESGGGLFYGF